MKTKYIIISLSLIAFMGFWMFGGILLNSGIHPMGIIGIPLILIQSFQYQESGEICQGNCPEQFQIVLDYCEEKKTGRDMNLMGLHYYNETHYIDNNKCEWQLLENYPNTNMQCIPGQHRYTDDDVIPMNSTHTFDNGKCEWVTIEESKINFFRDSAKYTILEQIEYKLGVYSDEQHQKVITSCNTPGARYTTGGNNAVLSYINDTHVINNKSCQYMDKSIIAPDIHYSDEHHAERNILRLAGQDPWFNAKIERNCEKMVSNNNTVHVANGTHYFYYELCKWEPIGDLD